jgi:hypothetical protein
MIKNTFNRFTAYPSLLLLLVQLISIVINPMLQATKFDQAIFNCFNLLALALAVWVINRSPVINWVA